MTATLVDTQLQIVLDGKVQNLGTIALPENKHFEMQVHFTEIPCNCPEKEEPMSETEAERLYGPPPEGDEDPTANQYPSDPGETSGPPPVDWELTLDSLPAGMIVSDVDHDDWLKLETGEWTHKSGPLLRSKSLAALWAPFTFVRYPGGS